MKSLNIAILAFLVASVCIIAGLLLDYHCFLPFGALSVMLGGLLWLIGFGFLLIAVDTKEISVLRGVIVAAVSFLIMLFFSVIVWFYQIYYALVPTICP